MKRRTNANQVFSAVAGAEYSRVARCDQWQAQDEVVLDVA